MALVTWRRSPSQRRKWDSDSACPSFEFTRPLPQGSVHKLRDRRLLHRLPGQLALPFPFLPQGQEIKSKHSHALVNTPALSYQNTTRAKGGLPVNRGPEGWELTIKPWNNNGLWLPREPGAREPRARSKADEVQHACCQSQILFKKMVLKKNGKKQTSQWILGWN